MTNWPKLIQARVQAYESFPGAVAIFVKKCSKKMSESVRKKSKSAPTFKLKIFKNLENIGQSAADKRSKIHRRCVFFFKKIFAKMLTKKKLTAARRRPGYGLTGPLFGPLFFKKLRSGKFAPNFLTNFARCLTYPLQSFLCWKVRWKVTSRSRY